MVSLLSEEVDFTQHAIVANSVGSASEPLAECIPVSAEALVEINFRLFGGIKLNFGGKRYPAMRLGVRADGLRRYV